MWHEKLKNSKTQKPVRIGPPTLPPNPIIANPNIWRNRIFLKPVQKGSRKAFRSNIHTNIGKTSRMPSGHDGVWMSNC